MIEQEIIEMRKKRVKEYYPMQNWDIALTENCNMACSYCFAKCNTRATETDSYLSKKNIDALIEITEKYLKKYPDRITKFKLYGGEPLLAANIWYILEEIISKLSKYKEKIQIALITNGLLLNDEIIYKIKKYKDIFGSSFSIMFSVDGFKENHDTYRVDKAGNGTFDRIYKNLLNYQRITKSKVAMQCVLTPNILNNAKDFFSFIETAYEDFNHNLVFSLLPMNDNTFSNFTHNEIIDMFKNFEFHMMKKFHLIKNNIFNVMQFKRVIDSLTLTDKDFRVFCGLGSGAISLMSNGDIFPCHTFKYDGNNEYKIGHITDNDIIEKLERKEDFYQVLNQVNKKCKNCKFGLENALGCLGGCVAHNINDTKYFDTPDYICVYNKCIHDLAIKVFEECKEVFLSYKDVRNRKLEVEC